MVNFSNLGGAILYVYDMERALVFYTQVLGLEVETFQSTFVTLKTKPVKLHLHLAENPPGPRIGETMKLPQIYFEVDDIEAAFQYLRQAKVQFIRDISEYDSSTFVFNFLDPDGNPLGCKSHIPHSTAHKLQH
jgi:predicted enzyme related to lactoylglutathione lyase